MRFKYESRATYKKFIFRKEAMCVLLLSSLRDIAYRIIIESILYN
jgi:hypothetical protein